MLTRRTFYIAVLSLGAAAFPKGARGQLGDTVTVRIRADDSVRAGIPPIVQRNLTIEFRPIRRGEGPCAAVSRYSCSPHNIDYRRCNSSDGAAEDDQGAAPPSLLR